LNKLIKSFDNPKMALQYLMLEKGLYTQLAAENAKAIQGLQPKFNIWTTGGANGEAFDPSKPIRDIFSTLPPLLKTVQHQTGFDTTQVQKAKAAPAI
jgi:flotillin